MKENNVISGIRKNNDRILALRYNISIARDELLATRDSNQRSLCRDELQRDCETLAGIYGLLHKKLTDLKQSNPDAFLAIITEIN